MRGFKRKLTKTFAYILSKIWLLFELVHSAPSTSLSAARSINIQLQQPTGSLKAPPELCRASYMAHFGLFQQTLIKITVIRFIVFISSVHNS